MPRFAILEHDHPTLHWDLLLELGEVLKTWRLPEPPRAGLTVLAPALPDHRLLYLDYEGPISGGRGSVRRWDRGDYQVLEGSEPLRDETVVLLVGERPALRLLMMPPELDQDEWTLKIASQVNATPPAPPDPERCR